MSNSVSVPIMKDCPNYSHWKQLISVWRAVTTLAKPKQADVIILTLDSDAQSTAMRVAEADRRKEDGSGVDLVIKELDALYEKNITQRLFSAYEEFEAFTRPSDMSIAKFISDFGNKVKVLSDMDVKLPESLLAFKLLKNANLGEECSRIVRVAVNTTNPSDIKQLTLQNMKTTILNAFDVRLNSETPSSSNSGGSQSSQYGIKEEPLDVFQSRGDSRRNSYPSQVDDQRPYQNKQKGLWRDSGRGDSKRRLSRDPYPAPQIQKDGDSRDGYRVNRIDQSTGKPSECRLCGSIYHWARQCPKYRKQLQDAAMVAQTVDVTLLSHSLENTNL